MDRVTKFLKKLRSDERERVAEALSLLISGKIELLDMKKLKGVEYIYRIRTGSLRIIFRKQGESITILDISRRDEKTYREY